MKNKTTFYTNRVLQQNGEVILSFTPIETYEPWAPIFMMESFSPLKLKKSTQNRISSKNIQKSNEEYVFELRRLTPASVRRAQNLLGPSGGCWAAQVGSCRLTVCVCPWNLDLTTSDSGMHSSKTRKMYIYIRRGALNVRDIDTHTRT